jgi:glycosyltransferase involved in cell wall biosynthesis
MRGAFIAETLDSVLSGLPAGVEVVVVDGASPDGTAEVVERYAAAHPCLSYHRMERNGGVDADYDAAVVRASGEYCWLMTDDDLVLPGAVEAILGSIGERHGMLVVNAEVRDATLSRVLQGSRLPAGAADRVYGPGEWERFFLDVADYITFIGGVVIRRDEWLSRERERYFGTQFVHVGTIFQRPVLPTVKVLAGPCVAIRYGNAMWTSNGFKVWAFKWPSIVHSLESVSPEARRRVVAAEPWRSAKFLLTYRALGGYSAEEYRKYVRERTKGWRERLVPWGAARLPASLLNLLAELYYRRDPDRHAMNLLDLRSSRHAWRRAFRAG